MVARITTKTRWSAFWKLALIAGIAAIAFSLGSAMIARSAPTGAEIHVCVNRYTGHLRHVPDPERCTSIESPISWSTFDGAALDDVYVNEDQPDSITSAMILDGTISSDDLGTDSVGADQIATGAVGSAEVADDSLTASDLAVGSVTSDEILDGSIGAQDLSQELLDEIDAQTLEGFTFATRDITVSAGTIAGAGMDCPAGTRVIGGGMRSIPNIEVDMHQSYPQDEDTWWFEVFNPGPNPELVTLYAACVGS